MEPKAETALVPRTVEEERALLEKQRLKTERRELRKAAHMAELANLVADVKLQAARVVDMRKHMFKTDEELAAAGLRNEQKQIVRQFEQPKKHTAFGVESSAKLIEAETRAQSDKGGVSVNVERLIIKLPEKGSSELPPAVVIDVEPK